MKRNVLIISVLILAFSGCKKNNEISQSGTETIETTLTFDNTSQSYYSMGFSFSLGQKISTLSDPGPDITLIADVDVDGITIRRLIIQTESFENSFYKYGEYSSASLAESAYKGLTSATVSQWSEQVDTVKANQVWIFRTSPDNDVLNMHYAKFRIISTVAEMKSGIPYGACTFEWAYQPNGTLTFPAK